jgi:hypothetical protein
VLGKRTQHGRILESYVRKVMRDFLRVRDVYIPYGDVSYENDVASPEADDAIDRKSRQERNTNDESG